MLLWWFENTPSSNPWSVLLRSFELGGRDMLPMTELEEGIRA